MLSLFRGSSVLPHWETYERHDVTSVVPFGFSMGILYPFASICQVAVLSLLASEFVQVVTAPISTLIPELLLENSDSVSHLPLIGNWVVSTGNSLERTLCSLAIPTTPGYTSSVQYQEQMVWSGILRHDKRRLLCVSLARNRAVHLGSR